MTADVKRLARRAALIGMVFPVGFSALPSAAQTYPENKPITLVVPFAAGGGTDLIARDLGRHLSDQLGQPIIIDNKGGGGGIIGAQHVARAKPDGHTLLLATSTFITSVAGQPKLPYDVFKDFTPVALLGRGPLMVIVNKETGIASIADLIARAKAQPGSLAFASSGPAGIQHLAGELFVQRTDTKMTHVPYKGGGPATMDLLSGQVQVYFSTVPTIIAHLKADKVRLLATTGKVRMKVFPDAPTVMETGVADYEVGTWWGVIGPAGLPPHVIAKLGQAVNNAAASDTMVKRFQDEGAESFRGSPEAFAAMMAEELKVWKKVVEDGNLKFE
jgi:tripartite-type tricarboxylate transporter receptor subunit TctC